MGDLSRISKERHTFLMALSFKSTLRGYSAFLEKRSKSCDPFFRCANLLGGVSPMINNSMTTNPGSGIGFDRRIPDCPTPPGQLSSVVHR